METVNFSPKRLVNPSTQTEYASNKGRGTDPIVPTKHEELLTSYSDIPTPTYPDNLNKVFNEKFIE